MEFFIILALAFGAMWLMTSRTRKQQKEATAFRTNLVPGQEVMTGSGLFGTVVDVEGEIVTLETSPGVTSRWLRPAIAKPVATPVADDEAPDLDEDDDDLATDGSATTGGATAYPLTDDGTDLRVPDDASGLDRDPDEDDDRR